jgi:WD40 repeat protein
MRLSDAIKKDWAERKKKRTQRHGKRSILSSTPEVPLNFSHRTIGMQRRTSCRSDCQNGGRQIKSGARKSRGRPLRYVVPLLFVLELLGTSLVGAQSTPIPKPPVTHNLKMPSQVSSVAFSRAGTYLAAIDDRGNLQTWTVNDFRSPLSVLNIGMDALVLGFKNDDRLIVILDGKLLVFDIPSFNKLLDHGLSCVSALMDAAGDKFACTAVESKVLVISSMSGKTLSSLSSVGPTSGALAFSPEGGALAIGSFWARQALGKQLSLSDPGGTINVLDLSTGRTKEHYKVLSDWFYVASFSPDGRYLAAISYDGSVDDPTHVILTVWDRASSNRKWQLLVPGPTQRYFSLSFTADSSHLLAGGAGNGLFGDIMYADVSSGLACHIPSPDGAIWKVAVNEQRDMIALAGDVHNVLIMKLALLSHP